MKIYPPEFPAGIIIYNASLWKYFFDHALFKGEL